MEYHGVLFDMDGTLIDSLGAHHDATKDVLARYEIEIVPEDWQRHVTIEGLIRERGHPALLRDINEITEEVGKCFREKYLPKVMHHPGIHKMLDEANVRFGNVGLVTSSGLRTTYATLERFDLLDYFKVLVTRNDVIEQKPHPEAFLFGAQLLRCDPRRVIGVEDSRVGITSARAAGLYTVGIATTLLCHDKLLSHGAHQTAWDHEELRLLLEILHSLGSKILHY